MAKIKVEKSTVELQASIISKIDIIEETLPRVSNILKKLPDFWLASIDLNLISFLDYCNTLLLKYEKEIFPIVK